MKQVIQLDSDGYFLGFTTADESPLEPGVFLIPAGAIDAPTPSIPDNHTAKWNGNDWVYEAILDPEPEPEPEPQPLTLEEKRQLATLSPAEFRLNLLEINELDNIESIIPNASRKVQILWEYANIFERMHPDLLSLAQQMGYTDAQMDAIFGIPDAD